MGSEEKRPIQRRPARILFFSSVSLDWVYESMVLVKSCSEDDEDDRILPVASFYSGGESEGERNSCLSCERKPMSTSARTNSGKPA